MAPLRIAAFLQNSVCEVNERMTIVRALAEGLAIIAGVLIYTALFIVVVGLYIVRGVGNSTAVGLAAVVGTMLKSPFYWLLLVAVVSGLVWLFTHMFVLKALAVGFGIVVSLIVFTVVESFVEGNLRAAGINGRVGFN
jgi:hypothetical protein